MAFNEAFARRMHRKFGVPLTRHDVGGVGISTAALARALVEAGQVLDTMEEFREFGPITGYMENDDGDCYVRGCRGKVAAIVDQAIKDAAWDAPWGRCRGDKFIPDPDDAADA